ncbi:hypothetical protein GGF43_006886, partial [Coemansia sp. RSA 2618]
PVQPDTGIDLEAGVPADLSAECASSLAERYGGKRGDTGPKRIQLYRDAPRAWRHASAADGSGGRLVSGLCPAPGCGSRA